MATPMIPSEEALRNHRGLGSSIDDWTSVAAGHLVEDQRVIVIDSEAAVEVGFEVLVKNGVSSAPIYNRQKQSYIGMFDYWDVITYVLTMLKSLPQDENFEKDGNLQLHELIQRANKQTPVPVKMVSDISRKNPFYSVRPETSIFQVAELFAQGVHRVAVLGSDNKIRGILTQSRVINYLEKNLLVFPSLDCIVQKSLEELGIHQAEVISVHCDTSVISALETMISKNVSSVAVVDSSGILVGNISLSDIKAIIEYVFAYDKKFILRTPRHSLLWDSCLHLISHVRLTQGLYDGQDKAPVFGVRPIVPLRHAIGKIVATKTHRVWVTDSNSRPIGIVSLTDIFQTLIHEHQLSLMDTYHSQPKTRARQSM